MKGMECTRWKLATEEERAVTSRAFSAYERPLEMVNSFRYLGRVISEADNNWPAEIRNLAKAQAVWRRMMRILSREGARPRLYGFLFKVLVQSVFIFCAETWVVNPRLERVLGGFQDQVTRGLMSGYRGGRDMEVGINLDGDGKSRGGF